jgi:hypothetical protein
MQECGMDWLIRASSVGCGALSNLAGHWSAE